MEPNKSDSKNKEPEKKESKGEEPEKKEYNYIEAKSLYTYEEAKKLGNQPWLIDKFVAIIYLTNWKKYITIILQKKTIQDLMILSSKDFMKNYVPNLMI